jgi:SynChlorMet cassette protein ScmD
LNKDDKPLRNPYVVLREEFDDWAVLFNPDVGLGYAGFGLNPTGVYLWKLLDGEHSIDELVEKLRGHVEDVPGNAREHLKVFVDALVAEGLAACGDKVSYRERSSGAPAAVNEVKHLVYEPPRLVNLSSGQAALGDCSSHGSQTQYGDCGTGGAPGSGCCGSGSCPTTYQGSGSWQCTTFGNAASICCNGTCASYVTDCFGGSSPGNCPGPICNAGNGVPSHCSNGYGLGS